MAINDYQRDYGHSHRIFAVTAISVLVVAITMVTLALMWSYVSKRLLLMIPTLLGIMLLNFLIVQAAPGGPVEQMIAKVQGFGTDATARITSGGAGELQSTETVNHQTQSSTGASSK